MESAGVSVIVPTYNRRPFLEDAVESVLRQSYDQLEVVVVDGGSDDGTLEFIDSIADDRLTLVANSEPRGLSAARNAGLEVSAGEYIVFLDDDDRLYAGAIDTLVETIRGRPRNCGGVYSAQRVVDESGAPLGERRVRVGRCERFGDATIGGPSCTLIRRAVVDEIGGFDESFSAVEDVDFWVRLFAEFHMWGVDEILYERRTHDDQITANPAMILRGKERLVDKHADGLSPSELATQYYTMAQLDAQLGETGRARRRLRRALSLDTARMGPLYYYVWLQFGTPGYRFGAFAHRHIYDPLLDTLGIS